MAETVSSIATLITVSLTIIQKTVKFIQETDKVDDLVKKLSATLQDLGSLIKNVKRICDHAWPTANSSKAFEEALIRCTKRLETLQILVEDLASRNSGIFNQKAILNIRSHRSNADIQEAIQDIKTLMDQIHQICNSWNL